MENIMKERVVKQFIFLTALYTMSHMITNGIYATYLMENGMSLLQVNLINGVFYTSLFICEIPTGAFADIFGRKQSFVMACVLRGLAEIIYGMSHTIWGFITAEIVSALGFTFMSGAFKAWLVDSLIHRGYTGVDTRVFGKAKAYSFIFGLGMCIFGSYLGAATSLSVPWFIGGGFALLTAAIGHFTMEESYFVPQKYSWRSGFEQMKNIAVSSFHYGRTDKAVRFILIVTFIQSFSVQTFNMYWQPFFKGYGVQVVHFGYVFAGMLIFLGIGSWVASHISTDNEKKLLVGSQIFVGTLLLLAATLSNMPLLMTFFLLHEGGRGFWEPLRDSYLHKRIPSHERATVDSFCSIAPHIGGALGLVTSGVIAQLGGIHMSWRVSSLILIIGALVVVRNGGHKNS